MSLKALASFTFLALSTATLVFGQANESSLRLIVTDANGNAAETPVHVTCPANQFDKNLITGPDGVLTMSHLSYGVYKIDIHPPGVAPILQSVEIRSSTPTFLALQLKLIPLTESVTVHTPETLLSIDQPGSVNILGVQQIQSRTGSIPGRSLQDLINSQPGWLYEGSAVLHPRGSEYQTQFVVDGVPLTDNRSPGLGPEMDADEIQSISIYTAGIPAEYGRKMGGIIELNTAQDPQPGLHGHLVLNGGSFASAGASVQAQYSSLKNSIGASAAGSRTDRYLNPVVPQNFSNTGSLGDFSLRYDHAHDGNKLTFSLRRAFSRYDIPNELIQQSAGQRQTASNTESIAIATWQRNITDHSFTDARAMIRNKTNHFDSNALSTPIGIFQRNGFREAYFKFSATFDCSRHEWKAGLDSDNTFLHESLNYNITDASQFAPGTATSFVFADNRPNLEQAAFLEDTIHLHNTTIAAGLRWDHYQLLANRQALQPRFALSRYFPSDLLLLHASYDRVFQTPSNGNILFSSSPLVAGIQRGPFQRLPVNPSTGDYYEIGASKGFAHQLRFDVNYFRRFLQNFADDNQLENTSIAFPISFRKAVIYGVEGKLELPAWHSLSGFASYSYQVGNVWFPVTGGLFIGADTSRTAASLSGHFPNSQDQRNTLRTRLRFQARSRLWVSGGVQFDSGLPFEFEGDSSTVLDQYGPQVLNRLNFDRGRILPTLLLSASAGTTLHQTERFSTTLQVDGENLNNTLDVLDFGGLFSGNAIGPPRSLFLRLTSTF